MYIILLLVFFAYSDEINIFCRELNETFPSGERIKKERYKNCENTNKTIEIPERITLIEDGSFYNCSSIVNVTITNNVAKIEKNAFYNCTNLKNIFIPDDSEKNSLKQIESSCFENCVQLNYIELPNSIRRIEESAFMNCISLEKLTLPLSLVNISNSTFRNCIKLHEIVINNNTIEIQEFAFYNCTNLSNISTLDDVKKIGEKAFFGCLSLKTIKMGGKLESIGSHAFEKLNLEEVTLGENLTFIGDYAFADCSNITSELTFGQHIESIGECAFLNCSGITGDLIFNSSLKFIGEKAFYKCSKLSGTLDLSISKIETIGPECFYGAEKLTGSIILPEVKTIGESAFEGCKSLSGSIEIGDFCEMIGKRAFYFCNGLKGQLRLSNILTKLEDYTFYHCSGLSDKLTFPSSIQSIGINCFDGCSNFSRLEFKTDSDLKYIYNSSFLNCIGFKGYLDIPKGVIEIHEFAFANCIGFDGVLTLSDSIETIKNDAFINCSSFSQLIFPPASKMTIGDRAFLNCWGFNGSLILPDQVSQIGKSAFENCFGFDEFIPSSSLKIVNERTFYNCSGFKGKFNFSASYTEFHNEAFCKCSGFTGDLVLGNIKYHEYVFANCRGFTSIDLKTNLVRSLGNGIFKGCAGIKKVLLAPNSTVFSHAFDGCTEIVEINIEDVSLFYPYAFANCMNLKGPITFSDSIENIPEGLFSNCGSINSLVIGEKIKHIEQKAFYGCSKLSGTLVLPFDIVSIDELAFHDTKIQEIVFYPPMPPSKCAANAFSSKPNLTLSEIYIYNRFCGMIVDENKEDDLPVNIPPPIQINESFANANIVNEQDSDAEIEKAFETLRKNHANSNKIVIVNPGEFSFSSKLERDEFIKVEDKKNEIYFKEGNLNTILDPDFPLTIRLDDSNIVNNFACKGNGFLIFNSNKSKVLEFDEIFDLNGTFNIDNDDPYLVPDEIIINSINLSDNGVFKKVKGKLVINDLKVAPYTNFSFEEAIFNKTISIEQTATLEFNDQINIENATINYLIHDFESSNPIIKGHIHSVPQKLVLQNLNKEKSPYFHRNYIIVSGWFYNSSCTNWLEKVDLGDFEFAYKYCYTLNNTSNEENGNEIYQSLVVRFNEYPIQTPTNKPKTKIIIIVIVVCSVVVVAIVVIVIVVVVKHKKKQQISNSANTENNFDEN